jgi:hypothetical protein
MPVVFTAFTASAPERPSGLTIAQQAAAVNRVGVLNAQASHFTPDNNAGFRIAEVECGWDSAWPTYAGGISSGYLEGRAAIALAYQNAGWQVAASAGIFNAPTWLESEYGANWQYTDQYGGLSGTPNFVFNPAIRSAAASYISALQAAMITAGVNVTYYRCGIAPSGECYLPNPGVGSPPSPGTAPSYPGTSGSFWAFDSLAQAEGGAGLPPNVGACPLIGWEPGASSYTGGSVNSTLATDWWNWYQGAVNNAHQWEIAAHRAGAWNGCIMLVVPGVGLTPAVLSNRLGNLLGPCNFGSGTFGPDPNANQAAYWPSLLSTVPNASNTVLDISSVYDGSGGTVPSGFGGNTGNYTGPNNWSSPTDTSLPLTSASDPCADPYYSNWSSVRWLAYLAAVNGGIRALGENVGDTGTGEDAYTQSLATQVAGIMGQAQACGLYGLMWASGTTLEAADTDVPHGYATSAEVAAGFNAY